MFAACTASRIGEVSGVRVNDIDTEQWIWNLRRQTSPGPGGMLDKGTKGKRAGRVPIIEEIRPLLLDRIRARQDKPDARLFVGPRGGKIQTGVLRKATYWDTVVATLGYEHLRRHDLRHTGLTWFADAGCRSIDYSRSPGTPTRASRSGTCIQTSWPCRLTATCSRRT
ncbi:tyrosine-type recombinase/integrase [Nocardia fluminea]|uniref:tyrosine-type recombinase/integrase n=1 Tax=Nocardia fluminea TaxID=134984 RepID=UPI001FE645D3|nr:tyrosine-type recombinase/integrase [Nocardia fluminea]